MFKAKYFLRKIIASFEVGNAKKGLIDKIMCGGMFGGGGGIGNCLIRKIEGRLVH